MKRLFCILFSSLLILCSCKDPISIGVTSEDGYELEYKYGEITLLDTISTESDIYTENYPDDVFVPRDTLSIGKDQIIYTWNTALSIQKENGKITPLCRDPLCDHMQRESCIVSYGLIKCTLQRGADVFFLKGNGVYRYSVETYKVTPYAIFSAMATEMFSMGRFLYVRILNEAYVKIDLETNMGETIAIESVEPIVIYPSEGRLYCLDQAMNILVCDQNMQLTETLIKDIKPGCYIQQCFQVYDNKIYYVTIKDEHHLLCVYDIQDGQTETYDDVYCFAISDGKIYMMLYDPIPGMLFYNGSEAVETTIQTAGKIYHAPLDEIDDMRLLTSFDIEGWQIDGYWIWATKRYLYTEGDHFTKDSAETGFWRYDIATDVWEEIREEDV